MRVDLPAPLSPSRPTISRRSTRKLTSASDRTSPKVFETFLSSITGGSPALDVAGSAMPPPRSLQKSEAPPERRLEGEPDPALPDFLRRKRRDDVDVLGVDEGARRVHVEAREAELLGQADVQDRQ